MFAILLNLFLCLWVQGGFYGIGIFLSYSGILLILIFEPFHYCFKAFFCQSAQNGPIWKIVNNFLYKMPTHVSGVVWDKWGCLPISPISKISRTKSKLKEGPFYKKKLSTLTILYETSLVHVMCGSNRQSNRQLTNRCVNGSV